MTSLGLVCLTMCDVENPSKKPTTNILSLLSLLAVLSSAQYLFAKDVNISVAVHDHTTDLHVEKVLSLCAGRKKYSVSSQWHRSMVEFYILCKALRFGGISPSFTIKRYANSARSAVHAIDGSFMMRSFAPWEQENNHLEDFYASDEVVKRGEFWVGVYTRPEYSELLKVNSIKQLRKFKAVTNKNWKVDWQTLHCMNVSTYNVSTRVQMFKMIQSKRADFLLDAFSAEKDMSRQIAGVKLVPVQGIIVVLNGARRYFIRKKSHNAKEVFDALQKGLGIMRSQHLIYKAYQDSGFYHRGTDQWKKLHCS